MPSAKGQALSKDDKTKLVRILGMMGSAHDGECLNAARMAHRMLEDRKLSWPDFLDQSPAASGLDRAAWFAAYDEGRELGIVTGHRQGCWDREELQRQLREHERQIKKLQQEADSLRREIEETWMGWSKMIIARHASSIGAKDLAMLVSFSEGNRVCPTFRQKAVFRRVSKRLGIALPG